MMALIIYISGQSKVFVCSAHIALTTLRWKNDIIKTLSSVRYKWWKKEH